MAAVTFKEYGLQDANTLEATQIDARVAGASTAFPLNDQEILCRHLHKVAADWVDDYQRERRRCGAMSDALLPAEFADLEPFAATWCLPTERERFAQRMASSMDEMQAFYDAIFPRAEAAIAYSTSSRSTTCPTTRSTCCSSLYSLDHGVVPGRGVAPAARPRHRRRLPRPRDRAGPVSDADRPPRRPLGRHRRRRGALARGHRRRGRPHRRGRTRPTLPDGRDRDRPRRRHAAARAHGHGAQHAARRAAAAGTRRSDVQDDPAFRTLRGHVNCRTTLLAGFTTVRNLGLFVKTGGYLLDVALARAIDNGWIDGPRIVAGRARDHAHRRPPRPHDVPAPRARTSCR